MAILNCYVSDRTLSALTAFAASSGRSITELAEAAIANEASKSNDGLIEYTPVQFDLPWEGTN